MKIQTLAKEFRCSDISEKNDISENGMLIPSSGREEENLFSGVFNLLVQDDKFKNALDTDNSGSISKEELETFLNNIKVLDGNEETVSVNDLITSAELIDYDLLRIEPSEDEFTASDIENIMRDMEDSLPVSIENIPSVTNTRIPSSGAFNIRNYNPLKSAKTLSNITMPELNGLLQKVLKEQSAKRERLLSIINGSDAKLQSLNKCMTKAFENYIKKLKESDSDNAEQIENLQKKIDAKQQEINSKDAAIAEKEINISNAENSYKNAVSKRENLENILSSLKNSSGEDDSLNTRIAEVSSLLETAKQEEEARKEALETLKQELETLKSERAALKEGEGGLDELNKQMKQLQEKSVQNNEKLRIAQRAYEAAKNEYEKERTNSSLRARSDCNAVQNRENKIRTAITDYNNNAAQTKYNGRYNTQAGKKLASAAKSTIGSKGYCLRGVNNTLKRVYGEVIPAGSAYLAADILASNRGIGRHFTEIQVSRKDLKNLPAGAVVVWNNNASGGGSNVSRLGKIHGHISVALGGGIESSDHIRSQIVNRDASFRVFVPNS